MRNGQAAISGRGESPASTGVDVDFSIIRMCVRGPGTAWSTICLGMGARAAAALHNFPYSTRRLTR